MERFSYKEWLRCVMTLWNDTFLCEGSHRSRHIGRSTRRKYRRTMTLKKVEHCDSAAIGCCNLVKCTCLLLYCLCFVLKFHWVFTIEKNNSATFLWIFTRLLSHPLSPRSTYNAIKSNELLITLLHSFLLQYILAFRKRQQRFLSHRSAI